MDWIAGKKLAMEYIKKYRHVMLVLLLGLLLMTLPESEEPESIPQTSVEETNPSLEESLEDILSHIYGAGKVEVLLTQAAGEETLYQTNEDASVDDIRSETVLITNSDRNEIGLVKQINPPEYLGAIILCQGADNANIRLSIMEAVMSVTGLTSDHITVLKMK